MLRIPWLAAFAGLVTLAVAALGWTYAGGTADAELLPVRDPVAQGAARQPRTQPIRVYFVKGEQLAPVERRVAPAAPDAVATRAVELVLAGPNDEERGRGIETAIPDGTSVRSLTVGDGTATLELDVAPSPGTAAEVSRRPARAAQIVYTLTGLPGVERVQIEVEGAAGARFLGSDLAALGPLDRHGLTGSASPARRPAQAAAKPAPADAAAVQRQLAALRYLPPDAVTGSWDYRTSQAVLAFQGWHGLVRDGIVGPRTLAALEAASRPQPASSGDGRRIEVHRTKGVVLVVDGADVTRVVHASTGARGYETPAGSYSVFRKERNSWSVPYRVWLPYAAYFNGGIAFHAYDEVPAWPVSHGCVRLSAPEAPFVYELATVGTPVVVY